MTLTRNQQSNIQPSAMELPKCNVCNKPAPAICAICKSSYYCSIACLQDEFRFHEPFCRQFANITSASPRPAAKDIEVSGAEGPRTKVTKPSSILRLGLLFAVDCTSPQYVWIKCHQTVHKGNVDENPELGGVLGDSVVVREQNMISYYPQKDHVVEICFRSQFLSDGSKPNKCISNLWAGKYEKHDWRGPVPVLHYVYNTEGSEAFGGFYEDVSPEDGRMAYVYLSKHDLHRFLSGTTQPNTWATTSSSPAKQKGVVINCAGYQKLSKKPKVSHPEREVAVTTGFSTAKPSFQKLPREAIYCLTIIIFCT
jgi:hypothetical protein